MGQMSGLIEAVTVSGLGGLIGNLATKYVSRDGLGRDGRERVTKDLAPHIEATFKRCSRIKTLLNPNSPVDLLAMHATQRFKQQNNKYDHYALVDYVKTGPNNIIITGTGGSGKSIFTKYLWLSLFIESDGRVPVFVELRNINSLHTSEFLEYIRHELTQGSSSISPKDFENDLKKGSYIIIADGFDEVFKEKRDAVKEQIVRISFEYPDVKIVVSGRPDDDFASWNSFFVVDVQPMELDDVLELVTRCEFDEEIKRDFSKKVESGLFDTHKSFLSNPLLSSMMLLTYQHNKEIPDRMHLFYEDAYLALFKRHDRNKPGGYHRKRNCSLREDEFKRLFSYFCLLTYYDQKYEFRHQDCIRYIDAAKGIVKLDLDSADFLEDIISSVCLMVRDGSEIFFTHRSFQEYFSAYCLAYSEFPQQRSLVSQFASRHNDQILTLLNDMNHEKLRDLYILPVALKYKSSFSKVGVKSKVFKFMCELNVNIEYFVGKVRSKEEGMSLSYGGSGEFDALIKVLSKIYDGIDYINRGEIKKIFEYGVELLNRKEFCRFTYIALSFSPELGMIAYGAKNGAGQKKVRVELDPDFDLFFQNSPIFASTTARMKRFASIVSEMEEKKSGESEGLAKVFGVPPGQ